MSRRVKLGILQVMSGVLALSAMATVSQAQEKATTSGGENKPLVILIKEGGRVPAQALLTAKGADAVATAFFHLSGGARLTNGDAGMATTSARGGVVSLPALEASRVGEEGYLTALVNRASVGRSIRVSTVSAEDFAEALRLLSVPEGEVSSSNAPLLDDAGDRRALGNPGAVLRVSDQYLIVDYALVDPSGWSDAGVVTRPPDGSSARQGGPVAAGVCIRGPFGPGFVTWESLSPYYYSVLPEWGAPLLWATAPDDDIDAIYNHWWGYRYAWKVPDHCTAHGNDGLACCCNAAASVFGGTCRTANFNGAESGWPNWPLYR